MKLLMKFIQTSVTFSILGLIHFSASHPYFSATFNDRDQVALAYIPKLFQSFDKAEPNSQFRGKYILRT
jgi:hypothetical protein